MRRIAFDESRTMGNECKRKTRVCLAWELDEADMFGMFLEYNTTDGRRFRIKIYQETEQIGVAL